MNLAELGRLRLLITDLSRRRIKRFFSPISSMALQPLGVQPLLNDQWVIAYKSRNEQPHSRALHTSLLLYTIFMGHFTDIFIFDCLDYYPISIRAMTLKKRKMRLTIGDNWCYLLVLFTTMTFSQILTIFTVKNFHLVYVVSFD